MRITLKAAGLSAALIATLALAGCVEPPPPVIPTSAPSATPVFTSDAAALAAAKTAYLGYVVVSDSVAQDGGVDADRFTSVVATSWLPTEMASARKLAASGRKQEGSTKLDTLRLEQRSQQARTAFVSAYACLDFSSVTFVDSKTGLNPSRSPQRVIPVVVDFKSSAQAPTTLQVERLSPWQGTDFCSQ
jgi:hypothetical protein